MLTVEQSAFLLIEEGRVLGDSSDSWLLFVFSWGLTTLLSMVLNSFSMV